MDRKELHHLVTRHVKSSRAFERLYKNMKLQTLPVNMPLIAGIDLWLATCPCSWRELAWSFYQCQLSAAVIEVKEKFTEGSILSNAAILYFILHIISFRLSLHP